MAAGGGPVQELRRAFLHSAPAVSDYARDPDGRGPDGRGEFTFGEAEDEGAAADGVGGRVALTHARAQRNGGQA